MAKRQKKRSKARQSRKTAKASNLRLLWISVMVLVLLGTVLIVFVVNRPHTATDDVVSAVADATQEVVQNDDADPSITALSQDASAMPAGRANYCQQPPSFPKDLGFGTQTYVGTSLIGYTGLTLSDASGRVYQDETWDDAGHLGPFVYDRVGNIYTAPAPFTNLAYNALDEQNRIYRVDAETGELAEWVELPAAQMSTQFNPFGVLGLFYDCDSDSIYAGSVAGSGADQEVGRIFQVDRKSSEVAIIVEDTDAMGVGVFNGETGKRLYFGSGRDSGVRSIALDETGKAVGEPRVEFFLAQFDEGGNEKAQRITFTADNSMVVKGLEFNYNLRAASEAARVLYMLNYQAETDDWDLVSIERTSE